MREDYRFWLALAFLSLFLMLSLGCVAPALTPAQIATLPDTTLCQRQLDLGATLRTSYGMSGIDRATYGVPAPEEVQRRMADGTSEITRRGIDCAKIVQSIHM